MKQTMALLDEWQAPEPSPYFDVRLQARLREEQRKARVLLALLGAQAAAVGIAATILLALGVGSFLGTQDNSKPAAVAAARGTAVSDLQYLEKHSDLLQEFEALDVLDHDSGARRQTQAGHAVKNCGSGCRRKKASGKRFAQLPSHPGLSLFVPAVRGVLAQPSSRPSPFTESGPRRPRSAAAPSGLSVRSTPGPHRGDWLRKYGNLPSDQAKRQLQQDKDFQRLPPERQQTLQRRLEHFTHLPPQQKQRVLNRRR